MGADRQRADLRADPKRVGLQSGWRAAQIGAAALAGRIVDQKGGALPGTTVTVVSVATGLSRTVCRRY